MTHRTIRIFCVTLSLIFVELALNPTPVNCAFPQNPGDEAVLRTLIERYFATYAAKDIEGHASLWSQTAPDLKPTKDRLQEFFRLNKQIETSNLRVRQLQIKTDRAIALVTLEVAAVDTLTSKPVLSLGKRTQNLSFVKEGGEWKVQSDVSAEATLASELAAAGTKEEREALLAAADPELQTVELRKELVKQAETLRIRSNYPKALAIFEIAEQLAQRNNDQVGLAVVWNQSALVRFLQADYDVALQRYEKAMAICQALEESDCLTSSLAGIGNVNLWRGDYARATEYFRKQLAVSEAWGNKGRIAVSLTNLGVAQQNQGNYSQALEYHQRSLSILESISDKTTLPAVLNRIGNINVMRGDLDAAMQYFEKTVALFEGIGNKAGVANGFNNIGVVQKKRGDYGSAVKYYQKSLSANEALGNKAGIANGYTNIGTLYRLQGNLGLALDYHQKSLALRESVGDKAGVASTLNDLGTVYSDQGNYPRALAEQEKSLSVWEKLGTRPGIAQSINNIGDIYQLQGDYDAALAQYQKALQLSEELGAKELTVPILGNIAIAYLAKGDQQRAAEYADRSATLAKQSGYREELWRALSTAGSAYRRLGQPTRASEAFREAISTIEAMRAGASGGEQEQQQSFEKKVSPYYRMVELLADQGSAGEALAYAERAKSRVLLDVLRSGRVNITKAMTVQEKSQEHQIRTTLVSLNNQLARETQRPKPDPARLSQLRADLEKARLENEDFQTRLYAAHQELQIQRGESARFSTNDASTLGADSSTAFLEYVVTDDQTYLFVLTGGTSASPEVKVFPIPVKRSVLARQVESFREMLASHNLLIREPARQAYDLLLKPAQALLRNKSNLIIVPDDVLWELPFQALLTNNNHYLIEQSAISYAPSLTVLREMIAKRKVSPATSHSSSSLFALGNPALGQETIERTQFTRGDEKLEPLPEAEREVQTLAKLYGASKSEVFIGAEAREDRAKNEAGKFRVLHFATHGIVNNASPMYSHLVLSQGDSKEDGLLEAWELLNMDLQADLVVLSACETARGRVGAGEGMIGLSWALFVAGTPTTVVSQWKVDSASTTDLMLEFHRNRLAANSKAQSLRKAMLKMLGSNQYKHPFYWAPFVVIGDAN
jgi:CHAT domain-containing protein/Tfp pilus assembly protein PilF